MDCKSSSIHQFHADIAIPQQEKRCTCTALQAVLVDAKSPALQQGHPTGISPSTTPMQVKQQGHSLTSLIQARQIKAAPNQPKN